MKQRPVATLVVATFLAALALLAPGSPATPTCAAAGSHHAALVVEHGDGSVVTRCVAFDAAQISGKQLLDLSGIAWSSQTFGGFGDAVCAVDSEPVRYSACPGKDDYWAVFMAGGGRAWQLSNVGISNVTIHDGDAEGLRFVPAAGVPAAPVSPSGVCRGAVATAAARPTQSGATVAAANGPTAEASSEVTPTTIPAVLPAAGGSAQGPDDRAPNPSGGFDGGLLIAAVVGGGLVGLASLRLLTGRRRTR